MNISWKNIIKGALSYTPLKPLVVRTGTGGTDSARYCYSVWMRHLTYLKQSGMKKCPQVVAELGPGDSIGIGLCALLCGAEKYYAFDVVEHAHQTKNIVIFKELIELFRQKAAIPDDGEFAEIKPKLNSYAWDDSLVDLSLITDEKIGGILANLEGKRKDIIQYQVPWYSSDTIQPETVDLIFSQAVMEHVIQLESAYEQMKIWLKPGGFISHQIDYKAHETHKIWNGHWKYSKGIWEMMMHGRSYPINREPHSRHISLIENNRFTVHAQVKVFRKDGYKRNELPTPYSQLSDDDLTTGSSLIVAQK